MKIIGFFLALFFSLNTLADISSIFPAPTFPTEQEKYEIALKNHSDFHRLIDEDDTEAKISEESNVAIKSDPNADDCDKTATYTIAGRIGDESSGRNGIFKPGLPDDATQSVELRAPAANDPEWIAPIPASFVAAFHPCQ